MDHPEAHGANLFSKRLPVRFSHCDPAGIVFFPRYLAQLNDLVEDWFNDVLRVNYAELISVRKVGLPTVRLECDFVSPGAFGSAILWQLSVERLGTSSLTLLVQGVDDGVLRFKLRTVLVATGGLQGQSMPLPDDLRAAVLRFQGEGAPAAG